MRNIWMRIALSSVAIWGMASATGATHAASLGDLSSMGDLSSVPVVLGSVLLVFGASRLRKRMGITEEEQDL